MPSAVSLVRSRAAEWHINPKGIGVVGFSVGGHIALATATGFAKRKYAPLDAVDQVSCRPDFAICCYSGYLRADDKDELWPGLHIPPNTPPVLLTHASNDNGSYGGAISDESAIAYLALKCGRCSGRVAHLRHRGPRLRRAAGREAAIRLAATLRQVAAKSEFVD